jgi:hypothetical protein
VSPDTWNVAKIRKWDTLEQVGGIPRSKGAHIEIMNPPKEHQHHSGSEIVTPITMDSIASIFRVEEKANQDISVDQQVYYKSLYVYATLSLVIILANMDFFRTSISNVSSCSYWLSPGFFSGLYLDQVFARTTRSSRWFRI